MAHRDTNRIVSDEEKHEQVVTPEEEGEQSVSGSTPSVGSDDDTLQNAQDMGLYEDADEEHPEEVGIAEQVEKD